MSRILYFTRDYSPHDHRFLSALAETEHRIYFLRLERSGRQLEDRPVPARVEQVLWRGGQQAARWRDYPQLLGGLQQVLRQVKPDLVHAGPIQSVAFLPALVGFKPLVSMSWGSDLLRDADQSAWLRWVTRYTLRRTTVLAGDCQAVREKAVSFGFPPERAVLFPWGVDLQRFTPLEDPSQTELRRRLGWQDAFVLLSLRSWEPLYGIDVVLRGFTQALERAPELRLLLLGNGSQAQLVQETVYRHCLEEYVHLGGQVKNDDLPRYYQAADLYLSASHSDGSSVSLMEALASGLPGLVSDIPGNREWLQNSPAGWLFADGNSAELAQGILRALKQRQDLPRMRAAARRLAEERADWSKNFAQLLRAYELALRLAGLRETQ